MQAIAALAGRPIDQVGILVCDLDLALERYARLWPLGRWRCWVYGPATVPHLTYRGRPGTYSMRLALNTESPQLELIQPLEGPSIYEEWFAARGEGLHHVAIFVESLEDAVASVTGAGYAVLQSGYGYGLDGDGGYAYFDTERDLGIIVEAVEVPRRRREPDLWWPAAAAQDA
jgi:methylmalonyl-CoA/ethylmalonyl-CoA epimerase